MKPAPFDYVAAHSLEEALAVKARHGAEARFLAGGQSLIPAMNFRLAQPALLIDIKPVKALDFLRVEGDGSLHIGPLTVHRTVERHTTVARHQPLLHEAAPRVAHAQVRNRGTLGGNLSHADPASEFPAVMLALAARMKAQSSRGERWLAARDFFQGVYTTALEADEMLAEIALPALPPRTGTCFIEVSRRQGDYAMMGVAAVVTLDAADRCVDARLAFCNAGATPLLAAAAGAALRGQSLGDGELRAAAATAMSEIDPADNVHATAAFRRHLAGVLARRALVQAAQRARASSATNAARGSAA